MQRYSFSSTLPFSFFRICLFTSIIPLINCCSVGKYNWNSKARMVLSALAKVVCTRVLFLLRPDQLRTQCVRNWICAIKKTCSFLLSYPESATARWFYGFCQILDQIFAIVGMCSALQFFFQNSFAPMSIFTAFLEVTVVYATKINVIVFYTMQPDGAGEGLPFRSACHCVDGAVFSRLGSQIVSGPCRCCASLS